jgi:hypothetical protein
MLWPVWNAVFWHIWWLDCVFKPGPKFSIPIRSLSVMVVVVILRVAIDPESFAEVHILQSFLGPAPEDFDSSGWIFLVNMVMQQGHKNSFTTP